MKTKKSKRTIRKRQRGLRPATGSAWVSVKDKLPMESEQVIAHYRGVYHRRLVIFWTDSGGTPHFGFMNEPDGKGSQPATHWHSLPELP